ncbi:MAG: hypothetical protein DME57_00375 [Verrucomicrobia bacterium]|nr:MAG: hypothetical protein DME57_00375 [Verrucomicrobiota bacterium]
MKNRIRILLGLRMAAAGTFLLMAARRLTTNHQSPGENSTSKVLNKKPHTAWKRALKWPLKIRRAP